MCWRSGHDARTGSRSCAGARAATTGCVLDARPRHRGRMGRARRAAGAPARPGRAIAEAEPRADRGACRCRRVVGRRDRVRRGVALREPTRRSSRAVHRPHPTARDRTAHPRTVRRSPAGSSAERPATQQWPTPCRPVGRPLRGRHDDRGGKTRPPRSRARTRTTATRAQATMASTTITEAATTAPRERRNPTSRRGSSLPWPFAPLTRFFGIFAIPRTSRPIPTMGRVTTPGHPTPSPSATGAGLQPSRPRHGPGCNGRAGLRAGSSALGR